MGKIVAEVIEDQQQNPLPARTENPMSKLSLWLAIVAIVLFLLLAGVGFYLIEQVREQTDESGRRSEMKFIEVNKQVNAYQSQLAAMQSQLATMDADVSGKDNYFNKKLQDFSEIHAEKLANTRAELNEAIKYVQRQLGKTRGDWLIADAEYLLSVANQRLHLMGDVGTTREALIAADQRLRESGDASVYKVRQQIAKDLDQLKTVATPDIVGIYASVQALKEKVPELAVLLPFAGKDLTESSSIHNHDDVGEEHGHGVLDTIFSQLEGYVTLRHSDMPIKEILSPEEAQFIKAQMGVKLEMIKLALVQQNDKLFKSSIDDAVKWLKENFAQNDFAGFFEAELDKLYQIDLQGKYPDISVSLKMLRDVVKLRIEDDKAMPGNNIGQPEAKKREAVPAPAPGQQK